MPERNTSPEQRARQQLRDLRVEVLNSVRAVEKSYHNPGRTDRILAGHQQRVAGIVRRGRPQPRRTSRQAAGQAAGDLPLVISLLWSIVIFASVMLLVWVTHGEAWPLLVPAVAYIVVGSFLWTVTVPVLMLVGVALFV
jgi:hypothetical protein